MAFFWIAWSAVYTYREAALAHVAPVCNNNLAPSSNSAVKIDFYTKSVLINFFNLPLPTYRITPS